MCTHEHSDRNAGQKLLRTDPNAIDQERTHSIETERTRSIERDPQTVIPQQAAEQP